MSITIDLPPAIVQRAQMFAESRNMTLERLISDYLNAEFRQDHEVDSRSSFFSCFAIGRQFVRRNADGPHDMDSIRESIAAGGIG